jgi:hypothetical protein
MTQREQILHHLQRHGDLTPLDALQNYGCARLAARVHELRQDGYDIRDVGEQQGRKRWARYRLIGQLELTA